MAKRKRLSLPVDISSEDHGLTGPLETKSYVNGWEGRMPARAAPISQMAGDAATKAALEELATEMRQARETGRLVVQVPLDRIDESYLVRDRVVLDDEDMEALVRSLEARGQQTPLEVTELGQGRFGLISGWRRLMALRGLFARSQDQRFAQALCLIRVPEHSADAYLAMVEENEIRAGISFYERARIAARATDHGVFETEKKALLGLFVSISYAKRSKIRSFIQIYRAFDDVLRFPSTMTERTGLALVQAMQANDAFVQQVRDALEQADIETPEDEHAVLTKCLEAPKESGAGSVSKAPVRVEPAGDFTLERHGTKLTVSGAGVDAAFEARLRAWLLET